VNAAFFIFLKLRRIGVAPSQNERPIGRVLNPYQQSAIEFAASFGYKDFTFRDCHPPL
jgi:hypothetical protein